MTVAEVKQLALDFSGSEEEQGELPEGWVCSRLGNVLIVNYGKGLKQSDRVQGPVPVYGSNDVVGSHDTSLTDGPTVIIGRKGSAGAVHYSSSSCWPIDTTYFVDDFNGFDPVYLLHSLRALNLAELDTSTAIPGLNRDELYAQEIPIPPLAEQKRIAAKIEVLLARVRGAKERLERVPVLLKRFRQAVLAAACSGRLTEEWRETHITDDSAYIYLQKILKERRVYFEKVGTRIYKEPIEPDRSKLSDVPDQWAAASMDQLACFVTSGPRGWAKFYADSGPVFIRAQNINTDKLRLEDIAHVQPPNNAEGLRTRVRLGDLLITITGANVTKAALVDVDLEEAYISQHVALARLVDPAVERFVFLWTISPLHGRAKLLADAYGAGKPGLNLDNIREMVVPLPPLSEQREIVRRVEALFKLAEAIERRVEAARARADKLTQAILAKAFRGELVPTEAELARREGRSYEPASQLLQRIRTARQGAEPRENNPRTPNRKK